MSKKAVVLGLTVVALSGIAVCAQQPAEVPAHSAAFEKFVRSASPAAPESRGGIKGGPGVGYGHVYRVIQIESDPPGALILINGRRFGTTPQAIRVDDKLSAMLVGFVKQGYLETGGLVDMATLTAAPCSAPDANALCSVIHADLTPRY